VCLPHQHDATSKAPRWEAFLGQVLEGDAERIRLLQEWFGYSMVYDTRLHKFMMLEGEGANGKSVVLEVLGALLGEDNIAAVPLELFGQRFQVTPTLHKLANIAPETDEKAKVDLGTLKQFVAGELMQWDRKGIEQIQARPTARLIVATNNRPAFADRTSGLWRRLLLIPFRVTIALENQDPDLVSKLKEELPGILNWALDGLARLRQQGRFTRSAIGEAALKEYQQESHPEKVFLAEHCEVNATGEVTTSGLFARYKQWSQENNYPAVDERTFGKAVVRMFPNVEKRRLTRNELRCYFYTGISLVTEPDEPDVSNVTEELLRGFPLLSESGSVN
jgi:putative DNA primase/helicase